MSKEISLKINAKDNASASIKKVGDAVSGLGSVAKSAFALFAADKVLGFFKDAISSAAEADAGVKRSMQGITDSYSGFQISIAKSITGNKAFMGSIMKLLDVVGPFVTQLINGLVPALTFIAKLLTALADPIAKVIGYFKSLWDVGVTIVKLFTGDFKTSGGEVISVFSLILNAVISFTTYLTNIVIAVLEKVIGWLKNWFNAVKTLAELVYRIFAPALSALGTLIQTVIIPAFIKAFEQVKNIWTAIIGFGAALYEFSYKVIGTVLVYVNALTGAFATMWLYMTGDKDGARQKWKSTIEDMTSGLLKVKAITLTSAQDVNLGRVSADASTGKGTDYRAIGQAARLKKDADARFLELVKLREQDTIRKNELEELTKKEAAYHLELDRTGVSVERRAKVSDLLKQSTDSLNKQLDTQFTNLLKLKENNTLLAGEQQSLNDRTAAYTAELRNVNIKEERRAQIADVLLKQSDLLKKQADDRKKSIDDERAKNEELTRAQKTRLDSLIELATKGRASEYERHVLQQEITSARYAAEYASNPEDRARNLDDADRIHQALTTRTDGLRTMIGKSAEDMAKFIGQTFGDALVAGFNAAFSNLASGNIIGAIKGFFGTITGSIGSAITQMGAETITALVKDFIGNQIKLFMGYGGILKGLAKFLSNPWTAGIAAVAIGVALSGLSRSLGAQASSGASSSPVFSSGFNNSTTIANQAGGTVNVYIGGNGLINLNDPSQRQSWQDLLRDSNGRNINIYTGK